MGMTALNSSEVAIGVEDEVVAPVVEEQPAAKKEIITTVIRIL